MTKKRINYHQDYHSTIFTNIYKDNVWGGKKGEYFSGTGSYSDRIPEYVDIVVDFIRRKEIKKIVEIGCGDFNVSNQILCCLSDLNYEFSYLGYDVVKPLIDINRKRFGQSNVNFKHKDGATGNIVSADLLIIRQVLQHLDNVAIAKIVRKFSNYHYVLVTEHQLSEKYKNQIKPNIDKQTGASIRVGAFSGVYVEKEPFNSGKVNLIHMIPENQGELEASINTYLIKFNSDE
ncbi:class I SAM-dependent methyltransferase [Pedobacter sp. B4-66]|uniref:class I SAM-dependent methyltransferase n=1 Tax=Pedobacter sp. B4-66 TaxID=2817280 RepID=UPI001BDA3356|nr:class I SAM-dependent methyltransferase [Pedobacter sp. B4-66]